jgi:CubicO group peptidase (beta-lactamase class C family)
LKFALDQNLVAHPGEEFNYTDVTPILMTGALQFSTQKSLFDFAKENLFDPMGFKNEEWMHQDKRGFDNGAYGLRLRPLDMQKFGLLYLNSGCWEGRRLISQDWVKTSFNPWIRSRPKNHDPDYGWYWWKDWYSNGWIGHIANGWLGQRIIVFPEQKVVVTMTAEIHDGSEEKVVTNLMNQFVIPAIDGVSDNDGPKSSLNLSLKTSIKKASKIQKISPLTEYRMIPSTKMKEQHHLFKTED